MGKILPTNMFGIELNDVFTVITLALLEGILSVDNALVLALLVRPLPEGQRRRALKYGIWGAFIFRLLAVLFAAYLIQFQIFKLVGGGYLLYLSIKHMFLGIEEKASSGDKALRQKGFWAVVLVVELTDIVFSIDSIATAVAFSNKIWVLWFGGIVGIILMRYLSGFFIKAIERFPKLEDLAYQLVFFVGVKLSLEPLGVEMAKEVFWIMMLIIMTIGISLIVREDKSHKHSQRKAAELVNRLKTGEITIKEALASHQEDGKILAYLYREGYLKEIE